MQKLDEFKVVDSFSLNDHISPPNIEHVVQSQCDMCFFGVRS